LKKAEDNVQTKDYFVNEIIAYLRANKAPQEHQKKTLKGI
jgi:hypothetical protein